MNKRWKPDEGQKYWYIKLNTASVESGHVDYCSYSNVNIYNSWDSLSGNCFKTKKEAQQKLRQIKKILKDK